MKQPTLQEAYDSLCKEYDEKRQEVFRLRDLFRGVYACCGEMHSNISCGGIQVESNGLFLGGNYGGQRLSLCPWCGAKVKLALNEVNFDRPETLDEPS